MAEMRGRTASDTGEGGGGGAGKQQPRPGNPCCFGLLFLDLNAGEKPHKGVRG